MAKLWYGHFNSVAGDRRELLAEDWANYIRSFITNGIRNGGTCLQVSNKERMVIKIDEGIANIQGYIFILEQDRNGRYYEIEVEEAHNQFDRIDRVVLRLDLSSQKRSIEPIILRGVASGNPVPPALTRNNMVYDLSLAQIRVRANSLVINSSNITDERFNDDVCGLINSVLGLDSSVWQKQFDEFMAGIKQVNDGELNLVKEQLEKIFNSQMTEIENWYNSVKIDITKLQSFDFDNLAELKGATCKTLFNSDGSIEETITNSANLRVIAKRKTTFKTNGDIIENIKVFEENGTTIMKEMTINAKFDSSGNITEEVL